MERLGKIIRKIFDSLVSLCVLPAFALQAIDLYSQSLNTHYSQTLLPDQRNLRFDKPECDGCCVQT
jgi:hypothetical protein